MISSTSLQFSLRALFVLLFFLTIPLLALTQVGSVLGKLITPDGAPIENVSVVISAIEIGTNTNSEGNFILQHVPSGKHIVDISSIGHIDQSIEIRIDTSESVDIGTKTLPFFTETMTEIIVSATRTERKVEDVPIPVSVIKGDQIEQMGSVRLSEILAEQTGLSILNDHGKGIQLQGFNADYTMILINGQPLIGRTSGTLDLDRITVNNIERIEITKGPSSSLYGSEALAGVINIITKESNSPISIGLMSKYRSFNTFDFNTNIGIKTKKVGLNFSFNQYSSDGYDLTPESISKTAAQFNSNTFSGKLTYTINKQIKFKIGGKYFVENQNDLSSAIINQKTETLSFNGVKKDWSISPSLDLSISDQTKLEISNYIAHYNTASDYQFQKNNAHYSTGYFNQFYNKSEVQFNSLVSLKHSFIYGGGLRIESVSSDRYFDVDNFSTSYAFAQHEWKPIQKKITILSGLRYDSHNQYSNQLSPKIAFLIKPTPWLNLKTSIGTGFKTPDFRQLYLNFTNPTVGYSVFGSSVMRESILELEQIGQIESILIDYTSINTIQSESSQSINFGVDFIPSKKFTIKVNAFRNDVKNLIESAPIALKTNGQQVFSYFNVNRAYTQGIESEIKLSKTKSLALSIGYQYLEAKDKDVIAQLKNGEVFAYNHELNRTIRLHPSDYKGLFNRSKHSGNIKLFFQFDSLRLSGSLRGIYHGAFGYGDVNNNSILDHESEFTSGFFTWHISLTKQLLTNGSLKVQLGADNLFSKTNIYIPSMPGKLLYTGISYTFNKN